MLPRPPAASIPDEPGCYQFLDGEGRCLYVGKAKRLRDRVSSYFLPNRPPRTARMLARARRVEWVCVPTERDALVLEANLIKTLDPEFNIKLREDYPYAYVALDSRRHATRVTTWRAPSSPGVERFGPYVTPRGARGVLDALTTLVALRPCTDAKFSAHRRAGKACLLADIGRCAAPCVKPDDDPEYTQLVELARRTLNGDTAALAGRIEEQMRSAAEAQQYERAALCRDRLLALTSLKATQITIPGGGDCDVFGIAQRHGTVLVQLLKVRGGTVVEAPTYLVELPGLADPDTAPSVADMVTAALTQRYAQHAAPPDLCVPVQPEGLDPAHLTSASHRPPRITVPRRGPKRALLEMARSNAEEALNRQTHRRAADLDARRAELAALQEDLALPRFPLRIEAVDISHLQGTATVSVVSCLLDGLPRPALFRRYRLAEHGGDDYAAMREVLTRRFASRPAAIPAAPQASKDSSSTNPDPHDAPAGRPGGRGAHDRGGLPDLLVIDGGPAQLAVAVEVLDQAGLTGEVPVLALAKRFEEVYLPGRLDPVRLDRSSPALLLLARARDETHAASSRFQQRVASRKLRASPLDSVPGLGPRRRARLLADAGSLAALRRMERDQLDEFTYLPVATRDALHIALHPPTGTN